MKVFKSFCKIMEEENLNEIYNCSNRISCVETNLWLGNLAAATNIHILKEKKVKYLLTVNSFPLPKNIINLNFIQQKYIKVFDNPHDDLLSHFDETYDFIENGLKKDVVLVHCCGSLIFCYPSLEHHSAKYDKIEEHIPMVKCGHSYPITYLPLEPEDPDFSIMICYMDYHGISRSATVLISYLMKKKKMMLKEALEYVKTKCESIEPNPGFLDQLKLYEIMMCTLDKANAQYKMYRLDITLHHMRKANALPTHFAGVIQDDPLIMPANADSTVYKCRKCRRVLARGVNEMPHAANGKYNWRDARWSEHPEERDFCRLAYFIEPLVWMENVSVSLEGKILCPNKTCRSKLGSFNWVSGVQCPCGTEVCPGFYLIPSKVDKQIKLSTGSGNPTV